MNFEEDMNSDSGSDSAAAAAAFASSAITTDKIIIPVDSDLGRAIIKRYNDIQKKKLSKLKLRFYVGFAIYRGTIGEVDEDDDYAEGVQLYNEEEWVKPSGGEFDRRELYEIIGSGHKTFERLVKEETRDMANAITDEDIAKIVNNRESKKIL